MTERPLYEKHDSFVGMRGAAADAATRDQLGQAATRRLEALLGRLDVLGLPVADADVVRAACLEALGRVTPAGPAFVLQPYVLMELARLADADLPRYLLYRYRYEMYPTRRQLDAYPPLLQIEPASICNYRCVFCYQTDESFTKRAAGHMGMMSLDTFKAVVDQAQGHIDAVTLASRGEPLIARDIVPMLEYLAGKFLALKVNTNAWYLDDAKAHALLAAGVNTLVFSADAAEEPAYSQFRVNGNLERVMANIEGFLTIQAKQYPQSRTITRVSGVKVPGTPNLDQMEAVWGRLVDQVAFVDYNPWENVYDQPPHDLATPCSDLWRRMFVWWDGRTNPCDVDYKTTLHVGTVPTQSLSEVWRGEAYEALRAKHLAGARASCEPCRRCVLV